MDDNALDKVVMSCVAAAVGAILVCSLVVPVFADMLGTLEVQEYDEHGDLIPGSGTYDPSMESDLALWSTMLGLVVLMVIVGFLIAIIRNSTMRGR